MKKEATINFAREFDHWAKGSRKTFMRGEIGTSGSSARSVAAVRSTSC
jgi:hypothetical protein